MFLSVIIPVYNVELYLHRCINSVIDQNMGNEIELLLVDDGSKDSSGNICDQYANKYDWIKVFHIANGGVGNARNYGLERAKGDYFTFIDSDDFLDIGIYAEVFKLNKIHHADIYVYGYKDYPESKNSCCHQLNEQLCTDNKSLSTAYLDMKKNYLMFPIYNKIFNSKKCGKIKFMTHVHFYEDYLFSLACFNQIKTIYILNQAAYNYVHHPGGLGNKFTAADTIIKIAKEIRNLSLSLPQTQNLTDYITLEYYNNLINAVDCSKGIHEKIKSIKILLSEIKKYGLLNKFRQYLGRRRLLLTFPSTFSVLMMFCLRKIIIKLR